MPDLPGLREAIDAALAKYRAEYAEYYRIFAREDSPAMRDSNPTVVLIPGIGMFSFGKNKTEARITGEFYTNAIHVMEGATSLGSGAAPPAVLPQAGPAAQTEAFSVFIRIMWPCHRPKLFALNTGNWRKQRFAGSHQRKN